MTASSSTAPLYFLFGKKKFQLFRGEGLAVFCSAGESCLNGEQEHNTTSRNHSVANDQRNQGAGTNRTPPWHKSVLKSIGKSLSFADVSSSVDWQTGNWQLSPLASTPLRVWGSVRGRGRGCTEKEEDYMPRGGGWKSETLLACRGRRFGHRTLD